MMANISQIGAGMIGQAMAIDLAGDHNVSLGDIDISSIKNKIKNHPSIKVSKIDVLNQKEILAFIGEADIVLLAVPGFLGFNTLKTIIEFGKNVVDISFSPENIMDLNDIAVQNNVTAIFDAGVAPGIPNYLFGYHNSFEDITHFKYYVGGLPKFPKKPFNYKAPFSPIDVIEEYIRPARMMVDGREITKPALSEIERLSFNESIELEAFNTDGLRSLLKTMAHVRNMSEKTLRYPGHAKLIKSYIEKEILQTAPTIKKLFKQWELKPGEYEFTILKVKIQTTKKMIEYNLYDEYDEASKTTSMARTTGYTATATINLILEKLFYEKGVFPPELVSKNKMIFDFLFDYLSNRDIKISKNI
ncbi:MAG: saccharopine dehydrogenase family protein [Candidatus Neomarinimicrobiota bacterium]